MSAIIDKPSNDAQAQSYDDIYDTYIDPCRDWSGFSSCIVQSKNDKSIDTNSVSSTHAQTMRKRTKVEYDECIDPCRDWSGFHHFQKKN